MVMPSPVLLLPVVSAAKSLVVVILQQPAKQKAPP